MENFIKLDYELLKRADINIEEKLIIAYIQRWQKSNKYCYETQEEISEILGIKLTTFKDRLKSLKNKKIIFTSNDRKYLIPFNNRKAIILVDEENPYPIENIVSNEIKIDEIIDTPIQVEIESQIEENIYNLEDEINLYEFIPKYYEGTSKEQSDSSMYLIDRIGSSVTIKELLLEITKLIKQKNFYNDIEIPDYKNNLYDNIKDLIKN